MSEDDMGQQELEELPETTKTAAPTFTSQSSLGNGNLPFQTNENTGLNQSGMSIMQSSPPPHSYRHSRAYRHFKNPPQPHMCIRTTTDAGEELFINVLSWTRIVIPQEPSDPIPLYGGMRVPPGSPRSPPIVFAVMANPEVLKDSGRHSKDPEERRAMIELMCDFVEAMNPGVKLIRNAIILKDRDISGELKDVWNAVQAQRDREREEQMLQQRQQQHYHNITTQQMFPKTATQMEEETSSSPPSETEQQQFQEETSSSSPSSKASPSKDSKSNHTESSNSSSSSIESMGTIKINSINSNNRSRIEAIECVDAATTASAAHHKNGDGTVNGNKDTGNKLNTTGKDNCTIALIGVEIKQANNNLKHISDEVFSKIPTTTPSSPTAANHIHDPITTIKHTPTAIIVSTPPVVTAPPKKEKLGGFLPNGCIFPRFKNSKHKDKDKDKEKDSKSSSKDKEKTLLNALKKCKDKKIDQNHQQQQQQQQQQIDESRSQYEKNCINLENDVEKLDINKIDSPTNSDNMFIKLKVAATSVAK